MSTQEMNSDTEKLAKLIKGIRVAMLTTQDDDGTLRSRPMATQESDELADGVLWFFTQYSSHKVHEIGRDHHVNLAYAEPSDNRYVSVSGNAQVVRDQAKVNELWSPLLKAWFPKGKEDPDVALLRVEITKAEYWDAPSSTFVQLVGFAKAVLTGKQYDPGENEKLNGVAHKA